MWIALLCVSNILYLCFSKKLFQRIHYLTRTELLCKPLYVVHVQNIMFYVFMISERNLLSVWKLLTEKNSELNINVYVMLDLNNS